MDHNRSTYKNHQSVTLGRSPVIRMYVDENGHQALNGDLLNPSKRFLCLTGVIMLIQEHDTHLVPMMDALKQKHFGRTDIVLHRREIISGSSPFDVLKDPEKREVFNNDLLKVIEEVRYRVISIVIDKYALVQSYGLLRAQNPYALALEYLMQRYQYWMQEYQRNRPGAMGDILAEARGGKEDLETKATYTEIYYGRGFKPLRDADKFYSSKEIKMKPKKSNIAGLQFVDMISHPARRYILMSNGLGADFMSSSYEARIVDILQKKFRRDRHNKIEGAGTVLFPRLTQK